MKYWLSHLPLEVWVDVFVFPWITREELGRIVDRFRNHKFAEYLHLQFYLHDWGKRKLNNLYYDKDDFFCANLKRLDFPQTPMPGNIKSIGHMTIGHLNAQILAFMRLIGPIRPTVDLQIRPSPSNSTNYIRTILAILLPVLGRITAINCYWDVLPTVKQGLGEKLAKLEEVAIYNKYEGMGPPNVHPTVNFVMDWLTARVRDVNGPALCKGIVAVEGCGPEIFKEIRQQFLSAKTPCTFALILYLHPDPQWADFQLNNGNGEELHGVRIGEGQFQITRHRTNGGTGLREWIAVEENKPTGGHIDFHNPTIGSLNARMDVPKKDVGKDKQKPSSSFCSLI